MKLFSKLRVSAALAVASMLIGARADAQSLGFGVTSSASSIQVSNALIYTINVTNPAIVPAPVTLVSNRLSASVQFLSATNTQGSFTNYGNVIVFDLGLLFTNAQLSLTVQPNAVGFITNSITVTATNPALVLLPIFAKIVTQVTNQVTIQADLGVLMTGPAQAGIVGDLLTYGMTATNLGPNDAPGVLLTNTLPPGVIFKSVSPANLPYSLVTSNLIFNLGTLAAGGGTNLHVTVQPTNAGVFTFSAALGAAGVTDTNAANNSASTNFTVVDYLSTNLVVSLVSTQKYNPQNGLVEQIIRVSNLGTNDVPAARVLATGLSNRLFNASGTNSGNPFVVYAAALGTNQSVNLLLQFLAASYFPLTNSQFQAFGVPPPDLTPPAALSTSASLNISRILPLANGSVLIEFPTSASRAYTVVYSDNVLFFNAAMAPPSILATGNRLQWIDYGPPTTVSAPTNSTARFYRVFLNP